MIHDLRFAIRSLLKSPGISLVAVVVLALGIGANTIVFSLVHGLVLEPLGFERPDRLVRLFGTEGDGRDRQRVPEATVVAAMQARGESRAFQQIAGAFNTGLSVTDADRPINPLMRGVTEGWFDMLGAETRLGRTFSAEEHRAGAKVVVLNHSFWQSHFGGDLDVVGREIELNYESHEVIGVMSPTFVNEAFPQPPVLWLPLKENPEPSPGRANYVLVARLAEQADLSLAQLEADRLSTELTRLYPETHRVRGMRVAFLHDSMIERFEPALMVLFGAVGFVLLIACSNVANLLLTRALGRRQEIAVRQALGAGRWHLARQLLTESLIISLTAAALGVLAAVWSIGPLTRLAPSNISVPMLNRVDVEPRVLLFSMVLAVLTTLFFGLLPLRQLFKAAANELSAGATRAIGGRSRRRVRSALVVSELALSMVLLVGAGLTIRSFQHLRAMDLGFDPEGVLVGRLGARGAGFDSREQWESFHRQALEKISAIPGVEAASGLSFMPTFAGGFGQASAVAPQGSDLPIESRPRAVIMGTMPGYFDVARHPVERGREFTRFDTAESEPVAVISRSVAKRLWPEEDPVDRTLVIGEGENVASVRVVGVAGDLRGVADNPQAPLLLYRPMAQAPTVAMSVYVRRAERDEERLLAVLPQIEDAVWSLTRDAPVYSFTTMEQMMRDVEWQPRFLFQLLTGFAVLALVLAATGIYAVLAYAVKERTREIGIRVAVGAGRGSILGMVGRDALKLSVFGVGLGLVWALAASRALESLLLGVSARDPWTYGLLALALVGVALLASFVPALRATRVDPVVALRAD